MGTSIPSPAKAGAAKKPTNKGKLFPSLPRKTAPAMTDAERVAQMLARQSGRVGRTSSIGRSPRAPKPPAAGSTPTTPGHVPPTTPTSPVVTTPVIKPPVPIGSGTVADINPAYRNRRLSPFSRAASRSRRG